ncbi:hypothetical protein COB55_00205 [Candidatus Wolfebacteria bacterium]|nr:MAG: hypothetical protein COB55_00205 [Candidatus Wolfebacteria bacterium]
MNEFYITKGKMSTVILCHHLGLGDHVMCHGIVREYCKKYSKVLIFSKPHNYDSVSFMFRDIANLAIAKGDDTTMKEFIQLNTSKFQGLKYDEVKAIGFQHLNRESGIPLEWQFYQIAGVPFEKKWSSFFINRDIEREKALFEKIAPKEDYVFLHEDTSRKYIIKRNLINKNYALVTPGIELTSNFSDYCSIIEKAKEIHVIDSSFMFLIDCLPYNNPDQKLYIHRYARENNEWQLPILKKDWHIFIEEPSKLDPLKNLIKRLSNLKTPIFIHIFLKRAVRKIFKILNWSMNRPKQTDILALIRRYVPGKSFIAISSEKSNDTAYISAAKIMGATKTGIITLNTLEKVESADIVFCSSSLLTNPNLLELLKKLRTITNQTLILSIPSAVNTLNKKGLTGITLSDTGSVFTQAGFEIREKHILPLDSCLVCRAVPIT